MYQFPAMNRFVYDAQRHHEVGDLTQRIRVLGHSSPDSHGAIMDDPRVIKRPSTSQIKVSRFAKFFPGWMTSPETPEAHPFEGSVPDKPARSHRTAPNTMYREGSSSPFSESRNTYPWFVGKESSEIDSASEQSQDSESGHPRGREIHTNAVYDEYLDRIFNNTIRQTRVKTASRNSEQHVLNPATYPTPSTTPQPTFFEPSQMMQGYKASLPGLVPADYEVSNSRYLGNRNSAMFLSQVDNLPNHHKCSLFLTNIPLSAKYSDIFKRITTGAVFALHLMKAKDEYPTQGAKLVFMNSSSAAEYIASQPTVHGSQIQIRYNRHGYLDNYVNYNRVLVVEGPVAFMGQKFWLGYFGHYSLCNFETVRYLPSKAVGTVRMEFRFIRIDDQAETCMQAVQ